MEQKIKNILVTGGAGFIGSNLVRQLTAKGYNLVVLDNLSNQVHGKNPEQNSPLYLSIAANPKVKFIKGTVTSHADWKEALAGIDAIIHLASETGTGQSMYEINKYIEVNIAGTGLLLDILMNEPHSIKKIMLASSRAVYGEGKYNCPEHGIVYPSSRQTTHMDQGDFDCKCPICAGNINLMATTEDSKIHPGSIYGITKQNQEQLLLMVARSLGIDAIAFRFQNVYGPGQSLANPYTGILSIFSTQIKNGKNINIFEDGKESRDFVFIDDVVDAIMLGLVSNTVGNNIFNVGSGTAIDVITVAKTLSRAYGSKAQIKVSGNFRIGDIRHNYADIKLAKAMLGYAPKVDFKEGIQKFCQWVDQQTLQEDKYNESIEEMRQKGLYK
jgi:dTDP-L-rhamnose 4-epimerase